MHQVGYLPQIIRRCTVRKIWNFNKSLQLHCSV